jgi:hypothetical protein
LEEENAWLREEVACLQQQLAAARKDFSNSDDVSTADAEPRNSHHDA